jgi:hypothetical protein
MTTCISTGEYIWRLVLALIVLWFGLGVFIAGRNGIVRVWGAGPRASKRFVKALAVVAWLISVVILASTLFGRGC